ncbi:MAG: hypothetical protein H6512_08530 [Acidimicrobiia bacterium]|nr:hypothetical protein [Acidimicrobiia bacterium]
MRRISVLITGDVDAFKTDAAGDGSLEVGAHITDVLPAGLDYLDESMRVTCPDGLPVPLTDAADGDGGTFDDGEFDFELPCGSLMVTLLS